MSHQLHCPTCSTAIPPDKINIQKTIAVCPNCGAVFNFGEDVASARKVKRRKAKQPEHLTHTEDERSLKLDMPMVTSNANKLGMSFLAVLLLGFWAMIANDLRTDPSDLAGLIVMSAVFLPLGLAFLSSLFIRQRIAANDEALTYQVRTGFPLYQRKLARGDYVDVYIEETTTTRESTMAARYNLYAERYDGKREMFIQNLPEETALYIEQALSAFLSDDDLEGAALNLSDTATASDDAEALTAYAENEQAKEGRGV